MSGTYTEEYTRLRRRLEGVARAMFEASRRDLEAARLLYEGGFYPKSCVYGWTMRREGC